MFGHKPPLMYWCQIVAFHLFGVTEFAARFFSAVFGIGAMLLTYDLGRTLFNKRVGLWSALALGSCVNFAVIARAATPDVYLTFFCTLALVILVRGKIATNKRSTAKEPDFWQPTLDPSWSVYAFAYAAIALAVLVKGPIVGAIVPMAVWGMFLLVEQRREANFSKPTAPAVRPWLSAFVNALRLFEPVYFLKTVWRMRPLTAIAVILLLAGPWYVWVGLRTDGEFLREFFLVHNFGRARQAMDSHSGPIFYYLVAVCIGTFPWCVLLGPAIGNFARSIRSDDRNRPAYTLLACWTGVWIGILSLAGTKLPSYIIPCYPALAVAFATVVDRWLTAGEAEHCRRWLRAAWGTMAAVGVGILIAVPIVTRMYLNGEWTPALVGIIPIAGAIIGLWHSEHGLRAHSLNTLAIVSVAFSIGLLGFAVLPIDAHQNSPLFADFARQHSIGRPRIASHNYLPPSLVYYHAAPVERIGTRKSITDFFAANPQDAFLITTSRHYGQIAQHLPPDVTILKRDRRFLRPGEVFLLGRQTSTHASRPISLH
jgi:4-amino-4-deoxy-L-arabinose transferase-like glycosyltransferase